jgi:hypothetical protein
MPARAHLTWKLIMTGATVLPLKLDCWSLTLPRLASPSPPDNGVPRNHNGILISNMVMTGATVLPLNLDCSSSTLLRLVSPSPPTMVIVCMLSGFCGVESFPRNRNGMSASLQWPLIMVGPPTRARYFHPQYGIASFCSFAVGPSIGQ